MDPTLPHPVGFGRFRSDESVDAWLPVTAVIRSHYFYDPRLTAVLTARSGQSRWPEMSALGREATLCGGPWRFKSAFAEPEYPLEIMHYNQLRTGGVFS